MEGNGSVTTSSPTASSKGCPASSYAWTLTPRHRHWTSPAWAGSWGLPPTKAPHTLVPPLTDTNHRSGSIVRWTQS